ncbi:MAG TPA: hypothetical protein PKK80_03540 [Bacilli bacterium]|nr:hypothetical protein [Bacilli bacterium]
MRRIFIIFTLYFLLVLTSCGKSNSSSIQLTTDEPSITITTTSNDNQTTQED